MPHLESAAALHTCETALRELMDYAYQQCFGSNWLAKVAGDKVEAWSERAEEEAKTRGRRGALGIANAGLAYANFFDLVKIARKHWEPLAPALKEKAETLALLNRFEKLRNAVGHNRPLVPFEQDLLAGIAGQIRNQVTIYMSSQDPVGDIYPRIESIADSFGRRFESSAVSGEVAGCVVTYDITVRPGDCVMFTCIGLDPQGRQLQWHLDGGGGATVVEPSGSEAMLTWDVKDSDVTETGAVQIYLKTDEAKYHRFGSYDHRGYFMFRVRPPITN